MNYSGHFIKQPAQKCIFFFYWKQKEMEIFPGHVREVWNKWELRVLVLLSLSWQVLLIIFGSRRKYTRGGLISFLVWVTYLSADWLATVSLGTLANSQGDSESQTEDKNHVLKALWAPFLLLHLGGPDTITAFSLEDNSLWLRHLLGLFVHVIVAFYIYLRSWTSNALTFIAIPIFISGIIKYSERTWVLRSASTQQFEDSLLSSFAPTLQLSNQWHNENDSELECLHKAYSLFSLFKRLYANLSLRFAEGQRSYLLAVKNAQSSSFSFKLVEVQLEFLYDVLYTKAPIIYSPTGLIFRFITFVSSLSALLIFHIFIDRHAYARIDIHITYVLFIGAVFLEIYAVILLVSSDWTKRWLTKNKTPLRNIMCSVISYCGLILPHKRRWSESMAQHNLLTFCLQHRVKSCIGTDFFFRIYFTLELYWQRTWKNVDADMKSKIFKHLLQKHEEYRDKGFDYDELKKLLAYKGDFVLKENGCFDEIGWSVEVEFSHSLLIWHIATDICFHSHPTKEQDDNRQASKMISDYLLYVLLMRPFMLPKGIDRITFVRDTYREITSILQRKEFLVKGVPDACNMMLQLHTQCHSVELLRRERSSKSVLLDACCLAEHLLRVSDPWGMICQVWIEKLAYAANQCEWQAHAQQLRRGGELLTHVCLLMADLGLSQQLDIGRRDSKIESQNIGWGWGKPMTSLYIPGALELGLNNG